MHACLSRSNDISTLENSRDGVRLNGGWMHVAAEVDVVHHDRVQSSFAELLGSATKRMVMMGYLHLRWALDDPQPRR